MNILCLLIITFFVGFFGDALLQFGQKNLGLGGSSGWGLSGYFMTHGSIESLFIASGMMTFFYILFYLSGLNFNYINLSIYGVILDLIFRFFVIFPSLTGYYTYFNYFWSAVWAIIPMCLPLFIYKILNKK